MSNPRKDQPLFNEKDVYGVAKEELEVDTDVNEDMNRERLLDESVHAFLDLQNGAGRRI
jgi:hypothetical protein